MGGFKGIGFRVPFIRVMHLGVHVGVPVFMEVYPVLPEVCNGPDRSWKSAIAKTESLGVVYMRDADVQGLGFRVKTYPSFDWKHEAHRRADVLGKRHLASLGTWLVAKMMVLFLGTLNIRCGVIVEIQQKTIILTTTHMVWGVAVKEFKLR